MDTLIYYLTDIWNSLVSVFRSIGLIDWLDIIFLAIILYWLIKLVRETRAEQLIKGVVVLAAVLFIVNQFGFKAMGVISQMVMNVGLIAFIVMFQPELRRADTTDSLIFYLENAVTTPHSSVLAVTNNRYCNRQFLQLALPILQNDIAVNLDIIGCSPDSNLVDAHSYDPFQLMQDLIGILDWIDKFRSLCD